MANRLLTSDFSITLLGSLENAKDKASICSAFIKLDAFNWLTQGIKNGVHVDVVARWKMTDLLAGASDLSVYEVCRERGWNFGICQNFHGKAYVIDDQEVYLGSANLTQRGMCIGAIGNIEFGTKLEFDAEEVDRLKQLLAQNVVWIDDDIYQKLRKEISLSDKPADISAHANWPPEIASLLSKKVNHIWVYELAFTTPDKLLTLDPEDQSVAHDCELFDLNPDELEMQELKRKFRESRLYAWICCRLRDDGEMNFGRFSHVLHRSLLDDPAPYRKLVKNLVGNIFAWMEFLSEEFEITRYERTKSSKLKSPN